ncbi:flagellar brake protein [Thalassobacillus sp. C254]|uniref:flagellar brake protein n=1 Tax=Thalassobacillus sp. C254 TaxID=1225341 RepID=UPI0006CF9EBA|nr:flagellar brake domain-containing protein [Thalassobacillus sp. C254]
MIEIGDRIFLERKEISSGEISRFRCRLVGKREGVLIIDLPINEETQKSAFFVEGTVFHAWIIGADSAVYSFVTEIQARNKDKIPVLLLQDPGEKGMKRIQRRNYVRVDACVNLALHSVEEKASPIITFTTNISGGGAAAVLPWNRKVDIGSIWKVYVVLHRNTEETELIRAKAKVVNVYKKEAEVKEQAALQFIEIEGKDREKIVRFCFEQQIAQRGKVGKAIR